MYFNFFKRLIDLLGSIFLLLIFSPIILVVAVIIKFTSFGPILVEKENSHMKRLGKNGDIFRLFKFRSMIINADILEKTHPKYKSAYIEKHTGGSYKPKNDPRVTPIGKFIRKYSIDEMPQLINVLIGDMSIVGPRPYLKEELTEQLQKYPNTKQYIKDMHTVKPGITGYWQVSGRSSVNFDKRIELDAYYAKKKSILFDFLIIFKTPWVMLSGKNTS